MNSFKKALTSTVGSKFIMALTGLGLVGFIIAHLLGNLSLYLVDSAPFNQYAHNLMSMGPLLLIAEVGLVVLFGIHILQGIWVSKQNKSARPVKYSVSRSKNGPSKGTLASRNMIITGVILLGFLILHILQFRLGPGIDAGYVTQIDGEPVRDLYRVVKETFQNPWMAGLYVFCMILLGMHFRHGFWSLFQSLGAATPRYTRGIYLLGFVIAMILAIGFLLIPIAMYFDIHLGEM